MAVKFTNNAKTTLASGITSSATSATVTDGSVFPSLSSGEHFYCTFDDGTNNEIVKVTARSSNTLTIVRAADNTTARAFSSGNQAELRATAALLTDIQENIAAKSANQTVYNTTTASSATTYDVGTDPGVEGNAMVFLNGVLQHHDTISFSGSTLTFDAAPPNGMALEVIIDNLINLQSSNLTVDTFTAADVSGSPQTAFTLSDTPAAEQNLIVFVDGVFQAQDAYTISNEVLTMTDGVTAGLDVTVYVINPVNIGTPSDSTVTSAKLSGDITTPGAFTVSGAFTSQGIDDNADATAITISSDENVAVTGDLSARKITSNNGVLELDDNGSHNGIINVPASISINIDSDNGATTESFSIAKDKTGINDTNVLFRVMESGNVGIGTTSIDEKLHVQVSSGDAAIKLEDASGDYVRIDQNSVGANDKIRFKTGSSLNERMRISSAGKVGIGTTSPGAPLHVDGSGTNEETNDAKIYVNKNSSNDWFIFGQSGADDYGMKLQGVGSYSYATYNHNSSAYTFRVDYGGGIHAASTSISSISDERLKKDIVDANSQWEDIKALRFRNFKWKDENMGSETYLGLIAQEAEAVSPRLIEIQAQPKEDIDAGIENPEYKEVKYSIVWMKAMKALQEAMTKIETLEEKVRTLENG